MNRSAVFVAGMMLAVSSASASDPEDFARQWPVLGYCGAGPRAATADKEKELACEGAFALALDESVYRQATRADLGDIAAFDADGEALAFGPMPASYGPPPGQWRDAAWFAMPPVDAYQAQDLHLHVTRDTTGSLQLDATLSHGSAKEVTDLLVDVRGQGLAVEAIQLELTLDAPDFSSRVRVEGSDDLERWFPINDAAAVAQLRQAGQALVRRHIEFPATSARYLRLHVIEGNQALQRVEEPLRRSRIAADFVGRDGRAFVYRLAGREPVERVNIVLGGVNTVANFSISRREVGARDWRYAGQLTAFHLRGAGVLLDNEAMDLPVTREQEWRIEPSVELKDAPALELDYRPETWLLLTHGKVPFKVAAGSSFAVREAYPLEALVGQVRAKYGPDWRPSVATLGAMQTAGGEAALSATDPSRKRAWLLWSVLILAAVAIIVMVLRLMGSHPDS
jgi:hypothetical protein